MAYYRSLEADAVQIAGYGGFRGDAYYARPKGEGPFPGVVLIHHAPGWDDWIMEATRKLAHAGFACIAPNLYCREPGEPDDQAASARAGGGVTDDSVIGDVEGAMNFLRERRTCNDRIGLIGFCSGGRHTIVCAGRIKGVGAIVDCWGGRVIPTKEEMTAQRPVAAIDYVKDIDCPILGIFGNDDKNPDVAQVNRTEEILKSLGKTYTFHRYDGAGHGFFAADRPAYRAEQATDAWKKVFGFFHKHLD